MTPAKRQATPASQRPRRTAPEAPTLARPKPTPPAETKDSTELLGPDGHQKETAPADPEHRATTQSQRRPGGLYPLPVWPD